ncbi:AlpA family phage regulatory protein [Tsuneonella sp. YG55]|uniref:AlpA family phage regulatory protein n=1 Tax=Tsuneonella litorea TaxID=2976475 RepID=A0A9X3A8A0_9SPHN|nr:AlpA family phage regulatory protein [Tsuneonella litorea]MCT2559246.1 AlpA family phage regulatory protein [Tsuneonella litorea]
MTLMSLRGVQERVPFSRSTIYAKIARNEFPAPIKISENRVAWDSAAIDAWITDKLQQAGV